MGSGQVADIYNGKFIFLKEHLDRLYKDLKLISIKLHLNRKKLTHIIDKAIKINKMYNDVTFKNYNISWIKKYTIPIRKSCCLKNHQ